VRVWCKAATVCDYIFNRKILQIQTIALRHKDYGNVRLTFFFGPNQEYVLHNDAPTEAAKFGGKELKRSALLLVQKQRPFETAYK